MSFIWVQQWVPLPVIFEGPMGDLPPQSRPLALDSAAGFAREGSQIPSTSSSSLYKSPDNHTPFHSQLSSIPQTQLRPDHRSPSQYAPQEHGATPFSMGAMAGALPEYSPVDDASAHPQGSQAIPRLLSGASTSAVVYQLGQNLQIPSHVSAAPSYETSYAVGPYQQQAFGPNTQHSAYHPFTGNQSRMPGGASMQTAFQNYAQPSQYMYYPAPYGHQGHYASGYAAPGAQNQGMYERRGSMAGTSVNINSPQNVDFQHHGGTFSVTRMGPGGLQSEQGVIGSAFGGAFNRVQGVSSSFHQQSLDSARQDLAN